jgi:hypothetical protein
MPDGATTDGATVVEGDAVVGIETDRAFATSPAMATMQIDTPTNHGDCTVRERKLELMVDFSYRLDERIAGRGFARPLAGGVSIAASAASAASTIAFGLFSIPLARDSPNRSASFISSASAGDAGAAARAASSTLPAWTKCSVAALYLRVAS